MLAYVKNILDICHKRCYAEKGQKTALGRRRDRAEAEEMQKGLSDAPYGGVPAGGG